MENLALIEVHRKRIALLIALFLFISLYVIVFVFLLTSAYYKNIQWNENLINSKKQVKNVVLTYNALQEVNDPLLNSIIDGVLENAFVWSDSGEVIVDNLNIESISEYPLSEWDFKIINGRRFYMTSAVNGTEIYYIIVSNVYETLFSQVAKTLLILLIISPFLYSFLAYLLCRVMSKMYKPLKEIIINLESFASNINHEFKTALTEIISSLELARLTGEYEEANKYSVSSAKRLNSMLDTLGMLIHFVNSDYRKERVNLYGVLDESIDDLEKMLTDKHIKIDKKYDASKTLYRYIDKSPLVLSFQNILKNAIKYSEIWGKIEISIFRDRFVIKDYGVGIANENLPKIFDRYFRESNANSGSGIGLSIIKRITEIYNWDIDIKSKKWDYTKVTLKF